MAEYSDTSMKKKDSRSRLWFMGLIPVILLAAIIYIVVTVGLPFFGAGGPPVEELTFNNIKLNKGQITAEVRNTGQEDLTIAQLAVNEKYVSFTMEPDRTISRLESATITIPYHWVEAEPVEIMAVSSVGTTFVGGVDVATLSPESTIGTFWMFTIIGLFVGVIPVSLGLLWKPFLAKVNDRLYKFFLCLTVGLLVFLVVDTLKEALEIAFGLSGALQGVALIAIGILSSMYLLVGISRKLTISTSHSKESSKGLTLAYMIAIGIGLHNLGEGLSIGAAYNLGEVSLGAFLILGFMIHNLTEGLAIVSPIARKGKSPKNLIVHLLVLGLIAGGPAIFGIWIGGFVYSNVWALVFLSVGIGAILQVVYEIIKMVSVKGQTTFGDLPGGLGIISGMLIMYVTGLLVIG
ncbi:ZIP family metal transporter [Virgibacillus necropolis]|uniref:ZIP family metal transporter n=1 Tax=Virgibacillus necropolis TaxID=163877 RepID=UPI00384EEC90